MKKTVLFLLLVMTTIAQAQIIKIEPRTVAKSHSVQDLNDPELLQQHAKVTNLTNQEIRLKWTRVILDQPLDWDSQVCDNNACYVPIVSTNIDAAVGLDRPVILAAGASFDMGLYVVPNGSTGEGSYQLIFALASSPNTPLDTITYNIAVNQTTSTKDIAVGDIRVFPNPTPDFFELTDERGVDRLIVYNLLGREVRSFRTQGLGQQYNMQGLPDGLYLVALLNERKGIVKTVRLSKRSYRP